MTVQIQILNGEFLRLQFLDELCTHCIVNMQTNDWIFCYLTLVCRTMMSQLTLQAKFDNIIFLFYPSVKCSVKQCKTVMLFEATGVALFSLSFSALWKFHSWLKVMLCTYCTEKKKTWKKQRKSLLFLEKMQWNNHQSSIIQAIGGSIATPTSCVSSCLGIQLTSIITTTTFTCLRKKLLPASFFHTQTCEKLIWFSIGRDCDIHRRWPIGGGRDARPAVGVAGFSALWHRHRTIVMLPLAARSIGIYQPKKTLEQH